MYYKMDDKILALIKKNKFQEALDELNKVEPADERMYRVLNLKKAELAEDLGQFFLANFYIILAKEGSPKDQLYYQVLSQEAKIAYKEKDYQHVLDCCKESLNAGVNNNGIVHLILGHAKKSIGDYDGAKKEYRKAITTTSSSSVKKASYYSLATLEFFLGKFALAETDIRSHIKETQGLTDKSNRLLLAIYLRQKRYKEAAAHIEMLHKQYPNMPYDFAYDVIVTKENNGDISSLNVNRYFSRQILAYDKDAAIEHIRERHMTSDTESYFSSEINLKDLYEYAQSQLSDSNVQYEFVSDLYQIPYPNVGYDLNGNIISNIRVVTLPGTKDIITMYPSDEPIIKHKALPNINQKEPQKTRTQRFNERLAKTNQQNTQ